jgi:hypothetical protein
LKRNPGGRRRKPLMARGFICIWSELRSGLRGGEGKMRCLAPEDVPALLGPAGFAVSPEHRWYRTALRLDPKVAGRQARVGASPPDDLRGLQVFLEQVNRWLPPKTARVLWIDHFESAVLGDDALLLAMRRGFGEQRALAEAPGHYVDPQPWREQDQLQVTRDHAGALSLLVGIAAVLLTPGRTAGLSPPASQIGSNFGKGTSSSILPAGAGSARRRNCWPAARRCAEGSVAIDRGGQDGRTHGGARRQLSE